MPNNIPKFNSFFMAGFECTYALAERGRRFDLLSASKHDKLCVEDYKMIKKESILTVREGLAWHQIDKGNGKYDFSRFEPMMRAAKEKGIQQIWDLNHFDYPEDLNPFSPKFPKRFGEYAKRVIETVRKYQTGTVYICPMNEPSFFAWMCDVKKWAPYASGRGTELKKQLIRASIAAMDGVWSIDKDVRYIHADPFMHRQPLRVRNEMEQKFCEDFNQNVRFHSWDMICGRRNPELGGDPKYLNILGVNYYFHNQQQVKIFLEKSKKKMEFNSMPLKSPLRLTLSQMLLDLYERYQAPIIITETGSHGKKRLSWWSYILKEVNAAHKLGLPLYGLCSYPTLDIIRGAGFVYPNSGLWDFKEDDLTCRRIPYRPALEVIKKFTKKQKGRNKFAQGNRLAKRVKSAI